MTAAISIVRTLLENYSGAYQACGHEAFAAREKVVNHAARTITPALNEIAKQAARDAATQNAT